MSKITKKLTASYQAKYYEGDFLLLPARCIHESAEACFVEPEPARSGRVPDTCNERTMSSTARGRQGSFQYEYWPIAISCTQFRGKGPEDVCP